MKLIVAGATGFVATEIIRQSLSIPKITSIIALARRPVSPPSNLSPNADPSKLHSVVLDNYGSYPDDVSKQLAGADACIWTVAITPSKSRGMDFNEVRRVCHDYTLAGLDAMFKAHSDGGGTPPFRFLYMSGAASERDQSKKPTWMPQYCLMRGETETRVLAFAASHNNNNNKQAQHDVVETCVAKPGLITAPGQYLKMAFVTFAKYAMGLPSVSVGEIAAAMLHEVVCGFEKEPLGNEDLVRIGREVLSGGEKGGKGGGVRG